MDYIDGPDLEDFIDGLTESLSPEQFLDIVLPILDAIELAHSKGIIHRDLKPANVLLRREGERWIPYVTDFGVAKILDGTANIKRRTATTASIGTFGYMSPEQFTGAKDVTERSDIFSLGALFYELAARRPAFGEGTEYVVNRRVEAGEEVTPEALNSACPSRWRARSGVRCLLLQRSDSPRVPSSVSRLNA